MFTIPVRYAGVFFLPFCLFIGKGHFGFSFARSSLNNRLSERDFFRVRDHSSDYQGFIAVACTLRKELNKALTVRKVRDTSVAVDLNTRLSFDCCLPIPFISWPRAVVFPADKLSVVDSESIMSTSGAMEHCDAPSSGENGRGPRPVSPPGAQSE